MDFLEISHDTANTARNALPPWPQLPCPQLSPSDTAAALSALQQTAHMHIDNSSESARARCEEVASFADSVCEIDQDIATTLRQVNNNV